jgi:hypothetical protein
MIRHWYDVAIHLDNIREVWRWTIADLKWLAIMGPAQLSKKIMLPEQGKFNAAEKINFMVLTATVPLYICTGLMIWSHQFAFPAWIVHFAMATAATPLMFGHVFMATVNPDTRVGLSGMVTGFVDRHWASHHYGRWYRETFADVITESTSGMETVAAADVTVASQGADAGIGEHGVSWGPSPEGALSEVVADDRDVGVPVIDVVPVLVTATYATPWTGQFQPAMATGHAPGRMPGSTGSRNLGPEEWEHEPLPPFIRPMHRFDRTRARRVSNAGSDVASRSDSGNA